MYVVKREQPTKHVESARTSSRKHHQIATTQFHSQTYLGATGAKAEVPHKPARARRVLKGAIAELG